MRPTGTAAIASESSALCGLGRKRSRIFGTSALLFIGLGISAQVLSQTIYTCRDDKGRMLTSDRPIPECAQRAMREMSASGTIKREIAAPLTAEQQRQRELEIQQQQAAELQRKQQQQRDRALTMSYPTMRALEAARRRQLDELAQDMLISQRRMADLHAELRAAQTEGGGRPVSSLPPVLQRRIQDTAQAILNEDVSIARLREQSANVNARFDDDARRLRVVLGEGQNPPHAAATGQRP